MNEPRRTAACAVGHKIRLTLTVMIASAMIERAEFPVHRKSTL